MWHLHPTDFHRFVGASSPLPSPRRVAAPISIWRAEQGRGGDPGEHPHPLSRRLLLSLRQDESRRRSPSGEQSRGGEGRGILWAASFGRAPRVHPRPTHHPKLLHRFSLCAGSPEASPVDPLAVVRLARHTCPLPPIDPHTCLGATAWISMDGAAPSSSPTVGRFCCSPAAAGPSVAHPPGSTPPAPSSSLPPPKLE
uniref:Uncharacterized protein n=1 Tax=Oryza punctata TaxID=4537 RepID=A0A0E0JH68_ORYPU